MRSLGSLSMTQLQLRWFQGKGSLTSRMLWTQPSNGYVMTSSSSSSPSHSYPEHRPSTVSFHRFRFEATLCNFIQLYPSFFISDSSLLFHVFILRNDRLVLNAEKCKEIITDFKKDKQAFDSINVNSIELELVGHAKTFYQIIYRGTTASLQS